MPAPQTSANEDAVSHLTTPPPPSIAQLPPWDGSWEPADPNQIGSGWNEDDYKIQGPNGVSTLPPLSPPSTADAPPWDWSLPLSPAETQERIGDTNQRAPSTHGANENVPQYDTVQAEYEALRAEEDPDHDSFVRILYSDYADAFERGSEALSEADNDVLAPADGDFPSYMDTMQAYLDYILLVRGCAARRSREGRPPAACSRLSPCDQCGLHDGPYVKDEYWHSMPEDNLDQHVREYARIRHRLPERRSASPTHIRPPELVFSPRPRSLDGRVPSQAPGATEVPSASPGPARIASPADTGVPAAGETAITMPAYRFVQDGNFTGSRTSASSPPRQVLDRAGPDAAELAMWEQLYATHQASQQTARRFSDRAALCNWPLSVAVDWRNVIRWIDGDAGQMGDAAAAAADNDDTDSIPSLLDVPESPLSASESE